MIEIYNHPNGGIHRLIQYGLGALLIVIAIAVPLQVVLALILPGAGLFYLTAILTALLALPVILQTTATPSITITERELTIHPVIWPPQVIPWDTITALKNYPLLPPEDAEAVRRAMIGKRKYAPAQGIMLMIPNLPVYYRVTGWFAGEGWTPVIAITNRSHQRYDRLAQQITARVGQPQNSSHTTG
ncbi:MAG: hypothetical protein MUF87_04755 [Anaerolineae bacterium]|jgi:hypothetical protein|nr:hypothetical protein [Anaerolineae bacterium]